MSEWFPEVRAAAEWWADRLSTTTEMQDNGDALQSAFATAVKEGIPGLNAEERRVFLRVLCDELQKHAINGGWERAETDPGWGSSARTVGVDYGPDRVLSSAASAITHGDRRREAQLSLLWPIKTVMWINPGEVTVSHGYRAERKRIYPAAGEGEER